MMDVMPSLMKMCDEGLLSVDLPRERELLTLFTEIKTFVKKRSQPVSWSFAFAIHALLTSVFEIQGNDDVHSLTRTAQGTFELYMDQVEWAKDASSRKLFNLEEHSKLRALATAESLEVTETETLRAAWNPLCAGSFILFISYSGNLQVGCTMLDTLSEFWTVLHLYNALRAVGLISPGDIEFLQWLDEQFGTCKAVWEGPKPARGKFVSRWWIAKGMTITQAKRMRESTRSMVHTQGRSSLPHDSKTRMSASIEPKDLSKRYRRICRLLIYR
jgi:hypothetical protein